MTGTEITPLHDNILIKRLEEDSMTQGGLYIPDASKEKPIRGEVIAIGSGRKTKMGEVIPLDVIVGDRVFFNKYAGTELVLNGNEYLMLKEKDILGIILD